MQTLVAATQSAAIVVVVAAAAAWKAMDATVARVALATTVASLDWLII